MDAVGPADREGVLVLDREGAERSSQALLPGDQQVRGLPELERGRGVPDVAGGEADVDEPRVLAQLLLEAREERDHLVLHPVLDREDPRDVDAGLPADPVQGVGGDAAAPRIRLADRQLDPEPRLVLGLLAPDAAHLRPGVAVDHVPTIEQNRKRWKRELGRPLPVAVVALEGWRPSSRSRPPIGPAPRTADPRRLRRAPARSRSPRARRPSAPR